MGAFSEWCLNYNVSTLSCPLIICMESVIISRVESMDIDGAHGEKGLPFEGEKRPPAALNTSIHKRFALADAQPVS